MLELRRGKMFPVELKCAFRDSNEIEALLPKLEYNRNVYFRIVMALKYYFRHSNRIGVLISGLRLNRNVISKMEY